MAPAAGSGAINSELDFRQLDGWFAIALLLAHDKLAVITDRLGEFHIYMTSVDSCRVLSTSSLVLAVLAEATWDLGGCRQFLATGTIFEPARTLFRGVVKLEPASVYYFSDGLLRSNKRYWNVASVAWPAMEPPGDVPRLADCLCRAVETILRNYPRAVFDLTGGFDTRGILGAVLQLGRQVDFVVIGDDCDPDVIASKRIAQAFNLRHLHAFRSFASVEDLWERAKESLTLCDGEQDVLYYALVLEVHSRLAQQFDATINGGVGEICQGLWWEILFPLAGQRRFDPRFIASRRVIGKGEIAGLLDSDFCEDLVDLFADVIRQINTGLEKFPNTAKMDNVYLTLWEQRFYGRTVSATSHLWPCISPYGFRGPLEAGLSAPCSARIRRRMSRRLIEHQNDKLAALPTANGYPAERLRLTNAHRFWPLLTEFAPLIVRRLRIQLGLTPRSHQASLNPQTLLLHELRELEEVRELTDVSHMASRELYNTAVLRRVLKDETLPPLGRILTLELAARAIK